MPKRDWTKICEVTDRPTRLAISLATDPEILECFARGFPHLFTDGDDEGPLRVPLSALQHATGEFSKQQWPDEESLWHHDRHFSLASAANEGVHLSIPHSYWWDEDRPTPQSVLDQLEGKTAGACMPVEFEGEQYVVLDIAFGQRVEVGQIIPKLSKPGQLILVRPEFIDLNA